MLVVDEDMSCISIQSDQKSRQLLNFHARSFTAFYKIQNARHSWAYNLFIWGMQNLGSDRSLLTMMLAKVHVLCLEIFVEFLLKYYYTQKRKHEEERRTEDASV